MYWIPPFLVVLLKRLEGCSACESNSDFKEHICVLKQGRVVWHFCEKWVNLLLEVPTQLLLVEPDSKWSETFLPVLGTIRFKSIRGNGFNWWMLATSILRLARNIPALQTPLFLISLYQISAIIRYLLSISPLSFVYISMGRENFLSVKLNQLRLQLSLAVKLLLQFLCLKLANSLSLPLSTNEYKKTTNTNVLVSSSLPISLLASPRNKPGLPLDLPNAGAIQCQCSQEFACLFRFQPRSDCSNLFCLDTDEQVGIMCA